MLCPDQFGRTHTHTHITHTLEYYVKFMRVRVRDDLVVIRVRFGFVCEYADSCFAKKLLLHWMQIEERSRHEIVASSVHQEHRWPQSSEQYKTLDSVNHSVAWTFPSTISIGAYGLIVWNNALKIGQMIRFGKYYYYYTSLDQIHFFLWSIVVWWPYCVCMHALCLCHQPISIHRI